MHRRSSQHLAPGPLALNRFYQPIRVLVTALVFALIGSMSLVMGAGVASAAPGEYTVEITGPSVIPVGESFSYHVTVSTPTASEGAPATGIVVTAQLPAGLVFDTAPFGDNEVVATAPNYDPATGVVTFTLRDLAEGLNSFVFTVQQVDTNVMDSTTQFVTTVTGSPTDSGSVPTASTTTDVTGALNYAPSKRASTVVGSNNRDVTYFFNVTTSDISPGATFTTWGQRLTDTIPAGAIITGTGTSIGGTWTITGTPESGQTAVWESDYSPYGPSTVGLDELGNQLWLSVRYPETAFPTGTRPPVNTVDLDVRDHSGTWETRPTSSTQGPVFAGGSAKTVNIKKTAHPTNDSDDVSWGHGRWVAGYKVSGSYFNDRDSEPLDSLTITDDSSQNPDNALFFSQSDIYRLNVQFNPTLAAAALPYTLEYTTSGNSDWQRYGSGLTTATELRLNTLTVGSAGFSENGYNQNVYLPLGETITGWRVVVSPGTTDATIPSGSEVVVVPSYVPVFDGPTSTTPQVFTNTATVDGVLEGGGALTASDSSRPAVVDRVPIITQVTSAPSTLTVGTGANYRVNISNMDPVRTYSDSVMRVVLPVGVLYDPSVGITRVDAVTQVSGVPVPDVGDGLTITTDRVTDELGEHQVVVFTFDELAPLRTVGQPKLRNESFGFAYNLPVNVLPQAYDPSQTTTKIRTFAYTDDPAYSDVTMEWYPTYFDSDTYDFSVLPVIATGSGQSTVATSGGLLIGKLARTDDSSPWSTTVEVASPGSVQWQIYASNTLADPVTDLVLFDRLPSVGDGRGSQFQMDLTGEITGAPGGTVVEYSVDATTATNGTWTTTAEGAIAFRVIVPSLESGANFTLSIPATSIPEGLAAGATANNQVTATANYHDAPRSFTSNTASVTVAPQPSLSLVKKTNGVEYEAAPGALVAEGSQVVWTYEVTNTGNTPLDDIALTDSYTDGSGSSGTLTPTTTSANALAPGQTRTFTATAAATGGQYHNVATATAVAVDTDGASLPTPVAPVTDESWYLAGSAGLTVVKTTNGQDVPSAPGLLLTPGDDVTWEYLVTNEGTVGLADISVVDIDSSGAAVFAQTVPFLAAGESTTLSAAGVVTSGQYHNTVTVTSSDPTSGAPLTSSDDSYYLGVVTGIEVTKLASSAPSGPWSDTVTVAPGDDVYWQVSVANTGNVDLEGVVVSDDKLGQSFTIDYLSAGTTSTRVLTESDVTSGYINSVLVTVDDPRSPDPSHPPLTDEDTAAVEVADPLTSEDDGILAWTGAHLVPLVGSTVLLLVAGSALALLRRRQTR